MQKYSITNKNLQTRIQEYTLFSSRPPYMLNSADVGNGYLEFYLNNPHNFVNGENISVNFTTINLANNIPISLRPKVMIGLVLGNTTTIPPQSPRYFWAYETDPTMWYRMDNNRMLEGYLDTIENTLDNSKIIDDETAWRESFRTFKVEISGNRVKEEHSNTWQEFTSNPITISCGTLSGVSISYTCVIDDTYFRIPYIELKREVNIIKSTWDTENQNFIITTDYGYDYGKGDWIEKSEDGIPLSKLNNNIGTTPEYKLCMNVNYSPSFYIPQSNFPIIANNDLFAYHNEIIKTERDTHRYCDLSIELEDPPCFENQIEYKFILKHDNPTIQRIELNCAGENYSNGIHFLGFSQPGAEGYFVTQDGVVTDIVLTNGGGYTTKPNVNLSTPCNGTGAMATAVMLRDEFINISDMFLIYNKEYLTFYKTIANYSININLSQDYTSDLMRTEFNQKFVEIETERAINPILDNERIRFEPVFRVVTGMGVNSVFRYVPINKINYQFYFNVNKPLNPTDEHKITKLMELGYTDNDVLYKKKRLARTFCRQTFYNNFNPTQYKLECFNSVFVNIDMLYTNYILNISNVSGNDINGIAMLADNMATEFNVFNPLLEKITNNYVKGGVTTMVEYIQSSSSEGYYLYLFGEEYKQLTPQDLYMKMEFNNALDGKRTLFFNRPNNNVSLNNVFFEQNVGGIRSRQHMYTDITVRGAKVRWNNTFKVYDELTEAQLERNEPFEVRYFWYPTIFTIPRINITNGETTIDPASPGSYPPNIEWDSSKLIIKFYEANIA